MLLLIGAMLLAKNKPEELKAMTISHDDKAMKDSS